MIARVTGKITSILDNSLLLQVSVGVCYQVFLPACVKQRIDATHVAGQDIELITYHYLQSDPSRSIPILIGFLHEIERDFFEVFITVSGIGPRAALKALNQPISRIAQAIDAADAKFLTSLPGIGQQRAREIIAKLQNKVGKFALLQDGGHATGVAQTSEHIVQEALVVLLQLQYRRPEAQAMIQKAVERMQTVASTEELLNEVYRQHKVRA